MIYKTVFILSWANNAKGNYEVEAFDIVRGLFQGQR